MSDTNIEYTMSYTDKLQYLEALELDIELENYNPLRLPYIRELNRIMTMCITSSRQWPEIHFKSALNPVDVFQLLLAPFMATYKDALVKVTFCSLEAEYCVLLNCKKWKNQFALLTALAEQAEKKVIERDGSNFHLTRLTNSANKIVSKDASKSA